MNFSNMFSDLAPISQNGYRNQLYSDPGIQQGIEFLDTEKTITNNMAGNLQLISQTGGFGSGIGSGKIIKGKIFEGLTANSQDNAPTPTPVLSNPQTTSGTDSVNTPDTNSGGDTGARIAKLKAQYNSLLETYNSGLAQVSTDYGGGVAPNTAMLNGSNSPTNLQTYRLYAINYLKSLENNLNTIYMEIQNLVKSGIDINMIEYSKLVTKIDATKREMIILNDDLKKKSKNIDTVSPLAEEEETALLSRRNYYLYILWFIITAIVVYITVANLINPNSSVNSLIISLILLIGLFVLLVYNKLGGWYTTAEYDIKSLHFPKIGNIINFDPLVTIKYTS